MCTKLLTAARAILDARDSQMITRIEWEALVERAFGEAKVYEGFLEVWSDACLGAAKAALAAEGVVYAERAGGWRFDVPVITASQYGRVVSKR